MKWIRVKDSLPTDETKDYLVWAYPIPEKHSPSTKHRGRDKTGTPKMATYEDYQHPRLSSYLADGVWNFYGNTYQAHWKVSHWCTIENPLKGEE